MTSRRSDPATDERISGRRRAEGQVKARSGKSWKYDRDPRRSTLLDKFVDDAVDYCRCRVGQRIQVTFVLAVSERILQLDVRAISSQQCTRISSHAGDDTCTLGSAQM